MEEAKLASRGCNCTVRSAKSSELHGGWEQRLVAQAHDLPVEHCRDCIHDSSLLEH
jgi:hypothetical protein